MPSMTKSEVFGDPSMFAIELSAPKETWPFVYCQLWISSVPLGYLEHGLAPSMLCRKLGGLVSVNSMNTARTSFEYECLKVVPPIEQLFDRGWDFFFGESFDGFDYAYFRLRDQRRVVFAWQILPEWVSDIPRCTPGLHVHEIPQDIYDEVVMAFLSRMRIGGYWDEESPEGRIGVQKGIAGRNAALENE